MLARFGKTLFKNRIFGSSMINSAKLTKQLDKPTFWNQPRVCRSTTYTESGDFISAVLIVKLNGDLCVYLLFKKGGILNSVNFFS